ncbi:MAG: hypothetical protein ACI8PZ_005066 [Myxococcota bacterium]|jgi:hypothetical protein
MAREGTLALFDGASWPPADPHALYAPGRGELCASAGSRSHWYLSTGVVLTGHPGYLKPDDFRRRIRAILAELTAWATGADDPVARRVTSDAAVDGSP